jgi:FlaA1/EpsC-like NDP-sugar epimerase
MDQAVSLVRSAMDDGQAGDLFIPKLPSYRLLDLVHAFCDEHLFGIKSYVASGLRPAEKLHESLISMDESESICCETPGGYVLHPGKAQQGSKRFVYSSENGPFLGMDELKGLIRGA